MAMIIDQLSGWRARRVFSPPCISPFVSRTELCGGVLRVCHDFVNWTCEASWSHINPLRDGWRFASDDDDCLATKLLVGLCSASRRIAFLPQQVLCTFQTIRQHGLTAIGSEMIDLWFRQLTDPVMEVHIPTQIGAQ